MISTIISSTHFLSELSLSTQSGFLICAQPRHGLSPHGRSTFRRQRRRLLVLCVSILNAPRKSSGHYVFKNTMLDPTTKASPELGITKPRDTSLNPTALRRNSRDVLEVVRSTQSLAADGCRNQKVSRSLFSTSDTLSISRRGST